MHQFISYLEYTWIWTSYFIMIKNHKKLFLRPHLLVSMFLDT